MRILCGESFGYRPWEVRKLTIWQVNEIFQVERDKDGNPVMDPEMYDDRDEPSLELEMRKTFIKNGISDPAAITRLSQKLMDDMAREIERTKLSGDDDGP